MTQDDIQLAKKAHHILVTKVYSGHQGQLDNWTLALMDIFAKLVAEREREACAKICDDDIEKWKGQADVFSVSLAIRARGKK